MNMFTRTKSRKAISAVLTTLIILVASVVLGTGVVLYGTSLFQTGAQSAGISTQGVHVWANSTSTPTYVWGAAEIRNSGDKILSVDTISVRGNQVPFANWYYDNSPARVTTANFQSQLTYTGTATTAYRSGNATMTAVPAGMMMSFGSTPAGCPTSTTAFSINEFGSGSQTNPTLCFTQASG